LEKSKCECIDINCGCPVPKIVKSGAGSVLTKEPELLYKIAKTVVEAAGGAPKDGGVPVTVKIRSGWDANHITWKEAALAAKDAGAAAITLHARTKAQGYEGKSDWNKLKELVDLVGSEIPVFGSGDLFSPEDAEKMLTQTGCSGVMFARGAMGNPFIFTKTKQLLQTGSYDEIDSSKRIQTGFYELNLLASDIGETMACKEMRKRFCAYSKGLPSGASLREKVIHAETISDYKTIFNEYI
jgi:nifR3 family TIM-barrel protein